jgi:uncharacterized cupredoxin-like copper-binding protein
MHTARSKRLGIVAVAVLLAGGCSTGQPTPRSHGTLVRVTERDFHISAPDRASSGDVVLSVTNSGPDDHELIVVRADDPRLPLRADGLTVDEEGLDSVILGALEPAGPGTVRQLHLHLDPGHYVFLCNMAGHYLGGMHTELVVT